MATVLQGIDSDTWRSTTLRDPNLRQTMSMAASYSK